MNFFKTLLFCVLTLAINDIIGQNECLELTDSIPFLYSQGQTDFAKEIAKKAIKVCGEMYGEVDENYAKPLAILASLYTYEQRYEESKKYYLKLFNLFKNHFGEDHEQYGYILSFLGLSYSGIGELDSANFYLNKALGVTRKMNRKNDECNVLSHLSELKSKEGQLDSAIILMQESIDLSERYFGKSSIHYGAKINNLGMLYNNMNLYDKALPLLLEANEIVIKVQGTDHPNYKKSLKNIIDIYTELGEFNKALDLLDKGLTMLQSVEIKDSAIYHSFLFEKGTIHRKLHQYEKAETCLETSLNYLKNKVLKTNKIYNVRLSELGALWTDMKKYDEALQLLNEALSNFELFYGSRNGHNYLATLAKISDVYSKQGKYHLVLPIREEIVEKSKQIQETRLYSHANDLSQLGLAYYRLGSYEKAHALFLESKLITERCLDNPEKSPDYVHTIDNLGLSSRSIEESLKYHSKALELGISIFGPKHSLVGRWLHNVGVTYERLEDYEEAKEYLYKSLQNLESNISHPNQRYAATYNSLGNIHLNKRQLDSAYYYYYLAHDELSGELDINDRRFIISFNNLAKIHEAIDSKNKAIQYLSTLLEIAIQQYSLNSTNLDETEKEQFLNHYYHPKNLINSFALKHSESHPEVLDIVFKSNNFLKNLLLSSSKNLYDQIEVSRDPKIKILDAQLRAKKQEYIKSLIYSSNTNASKKLARKVSSLEKKILKSIEDSEDAFSSTGFEEITSELNDSVAIVSFIDFQYVDTFEINKHLYTALVIKKDDPYPYLIPLFEEKELVEWMTFKKPSQVKDYLSQIYRGADENQVFQYDSLKLYRLIWQPLDSLLEGINKVYYSPSGILHRISFPAIACDTNRLISDNYDLIYFPSIRELDLNEKSQQSYKSSLVLGGIDFNSDSTALASSRQIIDTEVQEWKKSLVASEKEVFISALNTNTVSRDQFNDNAIKNNIEENLNNRSNIQKVDSLPYTKTELEEVSKIFQTEQIRTMAFTDSLAQERVIKMLGTNDMPSPDIIHLSTHGFFFPNEKSKKYKNHPLFRNSDYPLLRSGLIMAGGNNTWIGNAPFEGLEDGILTAYEVANLDLSDTELVVLAACETALGDIKSNEGAYSLGRAFKLAGAKNILMTLWKIPDSEAIVAFVKNFYTKLFNGMSIRDAFYETQNEAKEDPNIGMEVWGAFVLI